MKISINSFRAYVKRNPHIVSLAYKLRSAWYRRLIHRYDSLPTNSSRILLYRSGGGYGDNPRAVAEYLHQNYPDVEIIWAFTGQSDTSLFPEYIKTVRFGSQAFFENLATAGAWVCSTTLPEGIEKRPGQLYIQTWHGDKAIKRFANDIVVNDQMRHGWHLARHFPERSICDYYVTGCEWFVPIAKSALDYEGKFLRCGMPRNDCLVNYDEEKAKRIRQTLGIADNVSVLIYAPTFRDYEASHEVVESDIDLSSILDELEKKTGSQWLCLLRAHAGKKLQTIAIDNHVDMRFTDVTSYPDIADLLIISDALISDYSSCAPDFALRSKLILLYQDDYEKFTSIGRNLYFSQEESPYFTAHNMVEALKIIRNVDEDEVKDNCRRILEYYGSFETGKAAETVTAVVIDALKTLRESNGGS